LHYYPLADYRQPDFPANPLPEFVELEVLPTNINSTSKQTNRKADENKPDYEKEARKLKRLGDRGEKIVIDIEKNRLINAGKENLAKRIERVSLKSDAYGYDILSFNEDGTKRYIEVKATRAKVGTANFFLNKNTVKTPINYRVTINARK